MDDKELRRRMKKRKNKRKNVIKFIIALIFLCVIAAIAGFFIKVSIDNKYIFLCKVVTDSDSIVERHIDLSLLSCDIP